MRGTHGTTAFRLPMEDDDLASIRVKDVVMMENRRGFVGDSTRGALPTSNPVKVREAKVEFTLSAMSTQANWGATVLTGREQGDAVREAFVVAGPDYRAAADACERPPKTSGQGVDRRIRVGGGQRG